MRQTITRIIRHEDNELVTNNRGKRTTTCNNPKCINGCYRDSRMVLGRVPLKDYKVTYSINPKGVLKYEGGEIRNLEKDMTNYCVCWLPPEWEGKTLKRTVEVL